LGLTLQFFVEQMERRRTLNVLERFVSKNVAKQVLEDRRSFEESLSGQKKLVTILFSDIRGFTSMTEGSDEKNLVQHLNEYFKEMVDVVQDEKGTLQKFIGDAIMAAWGDVLSAGLAEDARRAVKTALRMRAELKKLNAIWALAPNRIPLTTGIGVNHGEAIVGNIGSPARMDFTVIGDAINLAARLETATKQFHVDILVGEKAESLTREHFIFRKVGLLTVKGRTRAVEAFTVLGERSEGAPPWLERYHEGVNLFRAREFQKAGEIFKAVSTEIGGADFLCELHSEWCARYQQEPPPADWAGNFVLTEK
jgi:adenylate cyclase